MITHPLFDINEQVWVTESGIVAETLRELKQKLPNAKIVGYYPNGYTADRSGPEWNDGSRLRNIWFHPKPPGHALTLKKQAAASRKRGEHDLGRQKTELARVEARAKAEEDRKAAVVAWHAERNRRIEERKAKGLPVRQRVDHNAILNLRAEGKNTTEISRELFCGRDTVLAHIQKGQREDDLRAFVRPNRANAAPPRPPKPVQQPKPKRATPQRTWPINKSWTKEQDALLADGANAGLSAGQIADNVGSGRTRNAVIGRCHRIGLQLRGVAGYRSMS